MKHYFLPVRYELHRDHILYSCVPYNCVVVDMSESDLASNTKQRT